MGTSPHEAIQLASCHCDAVKVTRGWSFERTAAHHLNLQYVGHVVTSNLNNPNLVEERQAGVERRSRSAW